MQILKWAGMQIERLNNKCKIAALVLMAFLITSLQSPSREYRIKATFLFNFTQFVEWPANTFENDNDPLVIGVMGGNPFGSFLDQLVQGEKINGRPLIVQHYTNARDIKSCHILFVNDINAEGLKEIMISMKGRHVLTASDASNFISQGGIIRFINEDNKVRFQINLDAAKKNDILISPKLLRLAEIVSH